MRKTLGTFRHGPDTSIRVQYWRLDSGPAGLDVPVLRGDGVRQHLTFFNPADVTAWFRASSRANVEAWRQAYHGSSLGEDDFQRLEARGAQPTP